MPKPFKLGDEVKFKGCREDMTCRSCSGSRIFACYDSRICPDGYVRGTITDFNVLEWDFMVLSPQARQTVGVMKERLEFESNKKSEHINRIKNGHNRKDS